MQKKKEWKWVFDRKGEGNVDRKVTGKINE